MRIAYIFLAALLAGCNSGSSSDGTCEVYDCSYDQVTPLGIRFRSDFTRPHIGADMIDDAYRATSECMGLWYKPNILVAEVREPPVPGDSGKTKSGVHIAGRPALVYVHGMTLYPESTLQHEFVHHILWMSTGDPDGEHVSPYFDICTPVRYPTISIANHTRLYVAKPTVVSKSPPDV